MLKSLTRHNIPKEHPRANSLKIRANLSDSFDNRIISQFDYADYLWDGQRDDFMKPFETVDIPQPKNKR